MSFQLSTGDRADQGGRHTSAGAPHASLNGMTSQGGGHGEGSGDRTPPFGQPAAPQPWQQYPYAPVDPQAPLNYPDYPPDYPPPLPYGMPPPYYRGPYDPYSHYR